VSTDGLIEPLADHDAVEHHHRPDRHFTTPPRFCRKLERRPHERLVHRAPPVAAKSRRRIVDFTMDGPRVRRSAGLPRRGAKR
jgi:hypothetical protein